MDRHGQGLPAKCPQLLDSSSALPCHPLLLSSAVLDEQQEYLSASENKIKHVIHEYR